MVDRTLTNLPRFLSRSVYLIFFYKDELAFNKLSFNKTVLRIISKSLRGPSAAFVQLIRDTVLLKETNEEIASRALDALQNHQWYLDQTLVPMSLLDPCVSDQTKKSVVCEKCCAVQEM